MGCVVRPAALCAVDVWLSDRAGQCLCKHCVSSGWGVWSVCVRGECSGAPSLLLRSCVTGLDWRVGRGHILGFSCSGLPDKGSTLGRLLLAKKPPGTQAVVCICVCVISVYVCADMQAARTVFFASNEKTCCLARHQQLKLVFFVYAHSWSWI